MDSVMKQYEHLKIQWGQITSATNNFDQNNFIGGGGFGKVYKGVLPQYKERGLVAFKRLDRKHGQGDAEFLKEITFLSRFKHQNLISLLGFCIQEKEMILVYEHASRGSLDSHLNSVDLTWMQRLNICLAAAKGLNHLHDPRETSQRLIHCDIKSANILLDDEWHAKVADFGLSKVAPANQQNSILVTNALGTIGYCDPEFMDTYTLTKESDVYSFGVVLFEVLFGRVCTQVRNGQVQVFVPLWKKSYEEKKLDEIISKDLRQQMHPTSLEKFSDIAYQCLKKSRQERPLMSLVVETLETALKCQEEHQKVKELEEMEQVKEYEEIVNTAVPPLIYRSIKQLKELLFKGFFVNGGTTWFSINHKEENYQMTSIAECLIPSDNEHESPRYLSDCNSRFEVGCYSTQGNKFETRVRAQFLTTGITYTVNLVFKCLGIKETNIPGYLPLRYKFKDERQISIVYLGEKGGDERLIARLCLFTSEGETVDFQFGFEDHKYCNSLEIEGIEFRPVENVDHHPMLELEYEELLKYVQHLQIYRSIEELKGHISTGVLLNEGKTWFSLNDKGEHCEMISIADGLSTSLKDKDNNSRYSSAYNSRFAVGTYNTQGKMFSTAVTTHFLSPGITYTVNLIFKCPNILKEIPGKQQYISLKYRLDINEEKIVIVPVSDKREDEWLMAKLHQFTSHRSIAYMPIWFHSHEYCNSLEIEGIEFRPLEINVKVEDDQVLDHEYKDIVKSAEPPLIYRSVQELKVLLSKGVILNRGKTWFYLNDNGQHCEMISIEDCFIPDAKNNYHYSEDYNSRFLIGTYYALTCEFKMHARAQFLSPNIFYTVNLVFKLHRIYENRHTNQKQPFISLKYKLDGAAKSWISYFAIKREDKWWMVELCQFTSDGRNMDLEIIFEDNDQWIVVEGIEFLPLQLEKAEHYVSEDEHTEMQLTSSDSNTYWEQKLPNDYEDIIKLSKDSLQLTTKKDLYLSFSKGFLINNGEEWFSLEKNGKKCLMLSARAACLIELWNSEWQSSPESRFGEAYKLTMTDLKIVSKIKSQALSSETRYATYLVYKLPQDQSKFEAPVKVMNGTDLGSNDDWNKDEFWYVYLVSPQTPLIVKGKVDGNTCNPVNRPKIKDLPQERSDGWMEVKVWEFQTPSTTEIIPMRLKFSSCSSEYLSGIIIQGIECRPI